MKKKLPIILLVIAAIVWGIYYESTREPGRIELTGMVTTDEVIVSSQSRAACNNCSWTRATS